MKTIYEPNGKPYLTIMDSGPLVKIQMHSYDEDFKDKIFFTIDKRAIPEIIKALQSL